MRTLNLRDNVMLTEKRVIEEALQITGGNRTAAAKVLGISLRALYYKRHLLKDVPCEQSQLDLFLQQSVAALKESHLTKSLTPL